MKEKIDYFKFGNETFERNSLNESIFENFECGYLFPCFFWYYIEDNQLEKRPLLKEGCTFFYDDIEVTIETHPEYFI